LWFEQPQEVGWGTGDCDARIKTEGNMAIAPTTKREADAMALKLFCLLAFILVGLITAGIL
jgi:hypothetical protein